MKPQYFVSLLEQAISMMHASNNQEGELRAKLALADIYMYFNEESEAQKWAAESLPVAEAMGYGYLQREAAELLNGSSVWHKASAFFKQLEQEDEEVNKANATDDEMRAFAEKICRYLGLPKSRFAVVEKEAQSMRAVAQEKLSWCQYIELLQDTRHAVSIETLYQKDPDRFGWCRKLNYHSKVGNRNWKLVLQVFKETYCKNCKFRSPKQLG